MNGTYDLQLEMIVLSTNVSTLNSISHVTWIEFVIWNKYSIQIRILPLKR